MPQIIINISEQQEAKIVDAIQSRRDFAIAGGQVYDGNRHGELSARKGVNATWLRV